MINFVAAFILMACLSFSQNAIANEITLSEEDAKTAQTIIRKDKMITEMSKDNKIKGLEWVTKLAGLAIQGPAKLTLQWNQALFKGWRKANSGVVTIGKMAICKDLDLARVTADNTEFFENMYSARGCSEE